MTGETPRQAGVVVLVGHPNVGKSTVFEALTGHRVIAANYPGTTVEIVRAAGRRLDDSFVDSPGILSFPSRSEDEQATVRVLLEETPVGVLQVGDAKAAVPHFKEATSEVPEDSVAWQKLAAALTGIDDAQGAAHARMKAVEMNPCMR